MVDVTLECNVAVYALFMIRTWFIPFIRKAQMRPVTRSSDRTGKMIPKYSIPEMCPVAAQPMV